MKLIKKNKLGMENFKRLVDAGAEVIEIKNSTSIVTIEGEKMQENGLYLILAEVPAARLSDKMSDFLKEKEIIA